MALIITNYRRRLMRGTRFWVRWTAEWPIRTRHFGRISRFVRDIDASPRLHTLTCMDYRCRYADAPTTPKLINLRSDEITRMDWVEEIN